MARPPRSQLNSVRCRCDQGHVALLDRSDVHLVHLDRVVLGHTWWCTACNADVTVKSSVEIISLLHEFGVTLSSTQLDEPPPALVSDARRLLSGRIFAAATPTEIGTDVQPRADSAADVRAAEFGPETSGSSGSGSTPHESTTKTNQQ